MSIVKGECIGTRLFFRDICRVSGSGLRLRDDRRLRLRDFDRLRRRCRCSSGSYDWSQPFSKTGPETPGIPVPCPPHRFSPWWFFCPVWNASYSR